MDTTSGARDDEMTEKAPKGEITFKEHELYQAAMQATAGGDEAQALARLEDLAELYPREQAIQDLIVRTRLRSTLSTSEPAPVVHSEPTPVLRRLVLALLALTVVLVGIVGFSYAYQKIVVIARIEHANQVELNTLRQEGRALVAAGDWAGARAAWEGLLEEVDGDAEAVEAIAYIEEQQALAGRYDEAIAAWDRGELQPAIDILREVKAGSYQHNGIEELIQQIEKQQHLEALWQQSEALIAAGDWAGAIAILEQIRAEDPGFSRLQVGEQLFQLHAQSARQLIAAAQGDVETLRQATDHLEQALKLRPGDSELRTEQRLAENYVRGADAAARGDWTAAISYWETVQTLRRNYQGGIVGDKLHEAYPLAARQLIEQANGDTKLLAQAVVYLDQYLAVQPGDEALAQERDLAVEFITGQEAFDKEYWDLAISHWGAIFAIRPWYQNGVLEENLRGACANSPEPSADLCPP
jgi:tetratricopeptide (TPR) repeat protein